MKRLLSGTETNGQFCLFENRSDGNTRTPVHVHEDDDETIYMIEGELTAIIDRRCTRWRQATASSCRVAFHTNS